MNISKQQIQIIQTLLNKQGLADQKEALVSSFTHERTTSLREMTSSEAFALIQHFKKDDPRTKMQRNIIAMAHEMKWQKADGKADMDRINGWVANYGYLKNKHICLNQYSYSELPALVSQFKQVYKSYLKAIAKN